MCYLTCVCVGGGILIISLYIAELHNELDTWISENQDTASLYNMEIFNSFAGRREHNCRPFYATKISSCYFSTPEKCI